MKVNREELCHTLTSLKPGIAKREIIEQGDCVIFDASDGSLYSFNEEIACYAKFKTNITGAVRAELLLNLLPKLPDDEIDIDQDEEGGVLIKCKKSISNLKCETQIRLPIDVLEMPQEDKWLALPDSFTEAVSIVEGCVSKSDTDFQLSSIHITPKYLESANSNQASRYGIELPIKESFLVRHGALHSAISNGVVEFAVTSKWLHFRNKHDLRISCHRYVEDYLDTIDAIVTKERLGTEVVIPAGVKEAVETASLFSKDNLKGVDLIGVRFDHKKQKLRISGEGINGYHVNTHKIEYTGDDIQFSINPQLFTALLTQYKTCELCTDCLKFANDHYVYITSLEPFEE
jgi:DNA polymerase III sliding clamp (beta) subunit (PCNA family)